MLLSFVLVCKKIGYAVAIKAEDQKLRLSHDKTLLRFTPPFSQGEEYVFHIHAF